MNGQVEQARPRSIRVALIDDHHLVREGLRLVLERQAGIEVVGDAADRDAAFAMLETTAPDVVLLDILLGDVDAVPMISALRARHPGLKIVVLTMFRDAETIRQALLAGAAGYVVKGIRSAELVDAIEAVSRGERYLHGTVATAIVEDSVRWWQHGEALSPREREVLSLYATGHSATEIGESLGLSANTVRRHIANIAESLGLRGRSALTRYATEHGVIRRRA